ncbi:unnamed protein product [Sphacelaria rigidula]
MRTRVRKLERSVSRLTAEIKTGQPVGHALQRVAAAGSEEDKRAVVIAAGSIVRVYIESAHELRNVSGNRDQKYAAGISRNNIPMNQFLTDETPPALLALLSSLCHLQVSNDDPDLLFPIVDEARSGRRGDSVHAPRTAGADDVDMSAARDGGAGLIGTAGGSGGGTAQQEHGGAAQGGSAMFRASARTHGSTPREKALRKKMRKRKRRIGRLYMLVQNLVKTVLGRGFRAMHDFHLAQVLKTHGTSVAVIGYVAAHGFCMTESMRYKREQFYVKWRMDRHDMALALRVAAIPWDDCDFRPTTSVTGGGAHVSTIAATCVAVATLPGHLSLMHAHRRQGGLVAADITTGLSWHRDGEQWERFLSVFDDAAFRCAVARIAGEGGHIETCLEIELRQVDRVGNFWVLSNWSGY